MAESAVKELPKMTIEPLSDDFEFSDWELVEDVGPAPSEFELELSEFLHDGESYVKGEIMLERAKEMGDLAGQRHAERIMRESQKIPVEWRAHSLVIAGTVRLFPVGYRYVLVLCWGGDRWYSRWYWLGYGLRSYSRVVRLCK